jgi:hypothetical protein
MLVAIGADLKDLKAGMKEAQNVTKKTANDMQSQFGNDFANSIQNKILGAFAIDALLDFGKAVIDITSEFQKFEAVLTNTLGSSSAAQIAMLQIQDFAAKTPFSVAELTNSFVKLANQGFVPTVNQLRQLGDLAASTGKSFDQLAEAILDAQTGEFERLKEFGIRAQKAGDNVIFTFKGVQTQVDFTNESIKQYITGLGDLQGVSGSMASINETLGGSVSNLGDSFDRLLVRLGKLTGGFIQFQVQALGQTLDLITEWLTSQKELDRNEHLLAVGKAAEQVAIRYQKLIDIGKAYAGLDETTAKIEAFAQLKENISKAYLESQKLTDITIDYVAASGKLSDAEIKAAQASHALTEAQLDRLESLGVLTKAQIEFYNASANKLEINKAELDALEKLRASEEAHTEAVKKGKKAKEEYTGIIAIERKKLEELEKARMNAKTAEEVGKYNDLIAVQKEAIEVLENYTLKIEQFNAVDIAPKGLDRATVMKPITNLPETFSSKFYKDLGNEMVIAAGKNKVFGDSFNLAAAQADILTSAINYLIESGVNPASPMIESLKLQLDALGQTMAKIVIDLTVPVSDMITTLAGAFGELAVGAASVDDFGQTIIKAMGDFVSQLGKMMIATGVASLALKMVVDSPYAAIAAGAALVALGAATSALMKKGPSSPSMSTGARSGGGAAASYVGHNRGEVQVYGMIRGKDIQLSNYKTTVLDQRLGR